SLAMAARILGREPQGLSVEESIHRVRELYDPGLHEREGTSRAQLMKAATLQTLDLEAHNMSTDYAKPADALAALDAQLGSKHLVVLTGITQYKGEAPSVYQRAMDDIYHAAIKAGANLYHANYLSQGAHAILVAGR